MIRLYRFPEREDVTATDTYIQRVIRHGRTFIANGTAYNVVRVNEKGKGLANQQEFEVYCEGATYVGRVEFNYEDDQIVPCGFGYLNIANKDTDGWITYSGVWTKQGNSGNLDGLGKKFTDTQLEDEAPMLQFRYGKEATTHPRQGEVLTKLLYEGRLVFAVSKDELKFVDDVWGTSDDISEVVTDDATVYKGEYMLSPLTNIIVRKNS